MTRKWWCDSPVRGSATRDSRSAFRLLEDGHKGLVDPGRRAFFGKNGQRRSRACRAATGGKGGEPTAAPRISHLVAWTRDRRQAAPWCRRKRTCGGSLTARDPTARRPRGVARYHTTCMCRRLRADHHRARRISNTRRDVEGPSAALARGMRSRRGPGMDVELAP